MYAFSALNRNNESFYQFHRSTITQFQLMQTPQGPFRAVLFDLDGTLLDSEPLHEKAWLDTLEKQGLQYDHHWFEQWIGKSDILLAASVAQEHQVDSEQLRLQKQGLFHELISQSDCSFPGVRDQLQAWKSRVPMAIATNSGREDVIAAFTTSKLGDLVDAVVTATDVEHLKPAPDMYLLAAKKIHMAPEVCVAVEDSPAGSEAARRAGTYVIGIAPQSNGPDHLPNAHEYVLDIREAFQRISALLNRQ